MSVNENRHSAGDLGLVADQFDAVSGTSLVIENNSHYITQEFPLGELSILTVSDTLHAKDDDLPPDLVGLGSRTGSPAFLELAVMEMGGTLWGGGSAAGRRVQLPWGDSAFDPDNLTADGQTILQRSLEWAGGAEIDLSPFAHWKLDETTGPTAVDSAGGNDGTWTNDPVAVSGVVDGGLDFDGSNDYVDAGSFDVIGSGITMMGWFNAEALTTEDERIVSKAAGTAEAEAWWQLSSSNLGADRFLRMRIKAGGTTTTMADSSVSLSTGTWYLAAATYDNTSGTMRLYLDGVEIAVGAHAVGGALDVDPSVPVAIGANGTAQRFFNGILDDVRIYDHALPASEIADLYAANPPPGATSYTEMYQPWSATSVRYLADGRPRRFGVPGQRGGRGGSD